MAPAPSLKDYLAEHTTPETGAVILSLSQNALDTAAHPTFFDDPSALETVTATTFDSILVAIGLLVFQLGGRDIFIEGDLNAFFHRPLQYNKVGLLEMFDEWCGEVAVANVAAFVFEDNVPVPGSGMLDERPRQTIFKIDRAGLRRGETPEGGTAMVGKGFKINRVI